MPYMPPFARNEAIGDYVQSCKPVQWTHRHIRSSDGTKIALCIGEIPGGTTTIEKPPPEMQKHIIICYFQGNGSSTPPRLPLLSSTLKHIHSLNLFEGTRVRYTIVALSYRGYWTSSGRASQSGIELDAQAALRWITDEYSAPDTDIKFILWGQSIGAGVATTAAATYSLSDTASRPPITGLILETPFSGIKSMLLALYPQKWLPYRYLWPFLWNHWDSEAALQKVAVAERKPRVLLLPAGRDEIVPPGEAGKLEQTCRHAGLQVERKDIVGALHTEATLRKEGQEAVARFVVGVAQSS